MVELRCNTQELYTALKIQLEGINKFKLTDSCLVTFKKDFLFFQTKSSIVLQSKAHAVTTTSTTAESATTFNIVIRLSKLINVISEGDKETSVTLSSSGLTLNSKGKNINLSSIDMNLELFKKDKSEVTVDNINPALLVGELRFLLSTTSVSKALGKIHNFDFTNTEAQVCYATTYFRYKAKHKLNLSLAPDTARFLVTTLSGTQTLSIGESDSYISLTGDSYKIYFPREDFVKIDVDAKLRSLQHITTIDPQGISSWLKILLSATPKDSVYINFHDEAVNFTLHSDTCGASLDIGDCNSPPLFRIYLPVDIAYSYFLHFEGKIKVWKGDKIYGLSNDKITIIFTSL